jgi:hypothetical protein
MTEQHHAFDAFDRQCEDLRDKWLRHRAKPEVWAAVEKLSKNEMNAANCALELRARVEALEAAAKPAESNYPAPSHSLVERVADTIYINATGGVCEQARAAIREVAAWLQQHRDFRRWASLEIAADLERAAIQDPS